MTRQDLDEVLAQKDARASASPTVSRSALDTAVSAVTAVPMSLPVVGTVVKRIRHKQPDQRVMMIKESPEDSCKPTVLVFVFMFSAIFRDRINVSIKHQ